MKNVNLIRCIILIGLITALAVISGCTKNPGAELTGTITLDGQPLPGGKVTFYHPSQAGRNVTANIQPDGSYKILFVPMGTVKATVVALPPRKDRNAGAAPRTQVASNLPKVPEKYTERESTDLVFEIRSKVEQIDIELVSR